MISHNYEIVYCFGVAFQTMSDYCMHCGFSSKRMMPVLFPFIDIRNMNLNDRYPDRPHGIGKRYGSMRIPSWIHDNAVIFAHRLMQLINQNTLMIRLETVDFTIRKSLFHCSQIFVKRLRSIYFRLSFPNKVKIWSVQH